LTDEDEGVSLYATRALGNRGREAKSAIKALKKALEDWKDQVRQGAARALEKIGGPAQFGHCPRVLFRLFWGAKRPITVELLRMLDLLALAKEASMEKDLAGFLGDQTMAKAAHAAMVET
jgi:hypothetical protein